MFTDVGKPQRAATPTCWPPAATMGDAQPSTLQQIQASTTPTTPGKPIDGFQRSLLVREGTLICSLAIANVREIMRPLPIQAMHGMPPYVQGASIIRGQPVPVVRLGSLLQPGDLPAAQRWVLLQVDGRHAALAVEVVLGVFDLDAPITQAVPPLLREAQPELVASIGSLDRELLVVLQSSLVLPADVWSAVAAQQPSPSP